MASDGQTLTSGTIIIKNDKIMDTNLKNAISAMRKDIAELEKEQKSIKPQMKTVHYTGERTMKPYQAAEKALANKENLRLYYAAYGLLRGKSFEVTENNPKREEYYKFHPLCAFLPSIDKILNKYGYQLKNYEMRENWWHQLYKKYNEEHYEEVICVSE